MSLLARQALGPYRGTPARPFLSFTSDSFFQTNVQGVAPIDSALTTSFRTWSNNPNNNPNAYPICHGMTGGTGDMWGMPHAVGQATDPIWTLTGGVPPAVSVLTTTGFHAPSILGDLLTGTSDSPFVVQDLASGWTVWASKCSVAGTNTISVGDAGYFVQSSNGLDKRVAGSDSTVNYRTRGAIPDAMVVRRDLVDYGIANNTGLGHVIHIFFRRTDTSAGFCWPLMACEQNHTGWLDGPEGVRIMIDPTVDLTTRGLSDPALVIARTLQQQGAYIGDNAGSTGTTIKLEQTVAGVYEPWSGLSGISQDCLAGSTGPGINWDDFVVITPGWPGS